MYFSRRAWYSVPLPGLRPWKTNQEGHMAIHVFDSTGEAYDACQTGLTFRYDEEKGLVVETKVETGDVLVIPSERVVGVCDTWPVAVTANYGKLHATAEGVTLAEALQGRKALRGLEAAQAEASRLGYGFLE